MTLFNLNKTHKSVDNEYQSIPFINIPSSLNPLPELGLQNPNQTSEINSHTDHSSEPEKFVSSSIPDEAKSKRDSNV